MSVCGYFNKRSEEELRMPRREPGEPDELGIQYEGDFLTGRISLAEALLRADLAARARPAPDSERFPVRKSGGVPLNTLTRAEWAKKIPRERAARPRASAPRRKK